MIDKVINGRYRVYSFIANGSITDIYLAIDTLFKRKVVVKFLKKNDQSSIYHLINESNIVSKINNDSVVKIYELGVFEKRFYNVLEFIEGVTIRKIIGTKKKFLEKCKILLKICEAIIFIHEKGIIHRDIKPDNIYYLNNKEIKINDFGISSDIMNKNKNDLKLLGSVYYLSPENVHFGIINISNDIYALGILAYELFYNKLPSFKKTDSIINIVDEINDKIDFNSDDSIPKEISDILRKATKKNYRERYNSVSEMKNDLENFLKK